MSIPVVWEQAPCWAPAASSPLPEAFSSPFAFTDQEVPELSLCTWKLAERNDCWWHFISPTSQ